MNHVELHLHLKSSAHSSEVLCNSLDIILRLIFQPVDVIVDCLLEAIADETGHNPRWFSCLRIFMKVLLWSERNDADYDEIQTERHFMKFWPLHLSNWLLKLLHFSEFGHFCDSDLCEKLFRLFYFGFQSVFTHVHFQTSSLWQRKLCRKLMVFKLSLCFKEKGGTGDIRWRTSQHLSWYVRAQDVWKCGRTRSAWRKCSWTCPTSSNNLSDPLSSGLRRLGWKALLWPSCESALMRSSFRLRRHSCRVVISWQALPRFGFVLLLGSDQQIRYKLLKESGHSFRL